MCILILCNCSYDFPTTFPLPDQSEQLNHSYQQSVSIKYFGNRFSSCYFEKNACLWSIEIVIIKKLMKAMWYAMSISSIISCNFKQRLLRALNIGTVTLACTRSFISSSSKHLLWQSKKFDSFHDEEYMPHNLVFASPLLIWWYYAEYSPMNIRTWTLINKWP